MDNEVTYNKSRPGPDGGEGETPALVPNGKDRGENAAHVKQVEVPATPGETKVEENQAPALVYPIGSSVGGLQALQEVLQKLDSDTGISLVMVTHLAPDQKSFLSEIIERYRNLAVSATEKGQHPEPDQMYVLLPNRSLADERDFAASVVESVPVSIVVLNQDFTIRTENTAFRTLTQSSNGLKGRSLPDLLGSLWGVDGLREKLCELQQSQPGSTIEFEHVSTTSQRKVLLIRGRALSINGSRVLLLTIEDITLQRETENVNTRNKVALEGEIAVSARELGRTQGELRWLNAHLFKAQEEERQRVARELHDDISQRLSVLEMLLHGVRLEDATADNRTKIKSAQEQIQAINTDVRQISHRLHPAILNDLGLSAALKALVTEFGERENMPTTYVTQNLPESWSPLTATSIYRITQEALRNVAKHAGKTHVKVVLAGEGDRLQLKIMDFGIGFDQEMDSPPHGLGMISMQERARLAGGTMNIASKLGEGTTVSVDLPVQQNG